MTDVRMPDGTVVRFPDDMPHEQIQGMILKKFPHIQQDTSIDWGKALRNIPKDILSEIKGISSFFPQTDVRIPQMVGDEPPPPTAVSQLIEHPVESAKAAGEYYGQYLTPEGRKKLVEEHPIGVGLDVLTGAGMATAPLRAFGRGAEEAVAEAGARAAPKAAEEAVAPETREARTARIKAEAGAGIQAAKESGVSVPASDAQGLLNEIKSDTKSEYNPGRHKSAKAFFSLFENEIKPKKVPKGFKPEKIMGGGSTAQLPERVRSQIPDVQGRIRGLEPPITLDVQALHKLRQDLNDVAASPHGQERQLAYKAKGKIDDFVMDNMGQGEWSKDMRNYALASTAEEIRNLVERASFRRGQLSAGQLAQAINTELRNWARPTYKGENAHMRMLRKLSPEAADRVHALATMKDPNSVLLKIMGTAAPTGVMPLALDEVGGHLLTGLFGIPHANVLLAGMGAYAKYLAGERAITGINDVIDILNDAAESSKLDDVLSPKVVEEAAKNPAGRQAIRSWVKAKGQAKASAGAALARVVARMTNTPQLVPRIEDEINQVSNQQ